MEESRGVSRLEKFLVGSGGWIRLDARCPQISEYVGGGGEVDGDLSEGKQPSEGKVIMQEPSTSAHDLNTLNYTHGSGLTKKQEPSFLFMAGAEAGAPVNRTEPNRTEPISCSVPDTVSDALAGSSVLDATVSDPPKPLISAWVSEFELWRDSELCSPKRGGSVVFTLKNSITSKEDMKIIASLQALGGRRVRFFPAG